MVTGYSVLFVCLFSQSLVSLPFLIFRDSIDTSSKIERFFYSSVSSLLISHQTHSLLLLQYFFMSSIYFWFFLRISTSLLILLICSCMLSSLSIRALSVLVIIVLNIWSDQSSIPALSCSDACSSLQVVGFSFLLPLIFLIARHNVGREKETAVNGLNNVVVMCGKRGSIL